MATSRRLTSLADGSRPHANPQQKLRSPSGLGHPRLLHPRSPLGSGRPRHWFRRGLRQQLAPLQWRLLPAPSAPRHHHRVHPPVYIRHLHLPAHRARRLHLPRHASRAPRPQSRPLGRASCSSPKPCSERCWSSATTSKPTSPPAAYIAQSIHLTNTMLFMAALALTAWFLTRIAPQANPRYNRKPQRPHRPALQSCRRLLVAATGSLAALADTLFPSSSLAAAFSFGLLRHLPHPSSTCAGCIPQ